MGMAKGIRATTDAAAEWAGMPEAVRFFGYLSSSGKNKVIKKSYALATKAYRRKLKAKTPIGKNKSAITGVKGLNPGKPLKNTISAVRSKKYSNKKNLIDPLLTGHLVKRGARHLHLVVLGRPAIKADGSSLHKAKAGSVRKKAMRFRGKDGSVYVVKKVRKQKPDPFVGEVFASMRGDIESKFAKSFIGGANIVAKKILKQYYGY